MVPVHAATAVAVSRDNAYGYSFNHVDVAAAQDAAVASCEARSKTPCRIIVACKGNGFAAISMRRYPVGQVEAVGASCGAGDAATANRLAIQACNQNARTGRCGQPRTAWRDTSVSER
jgi:hypothetical protein